MKTLIQRHLALVAALICISAAPASASLIGASVTGTANLSNGDGNNYYGTGFATFGPLSIVADPGLEFACYCGGGIIITADFTATSLTLRYDPRGWGFGFTQTFTSSAFLGLDLTKISDDYGFGGVSGTALGDTLTFTFGGGITPFVELVNLQATFDLQPSGPAAPEPSTMVLFGIALAGLGLRYRRKARGTTNVTRA